MDIALLRRAVLQRTLPLVSAAGLVFAAAPASATDLDFDSLTNGEAGPFTFAVGPGTVTIDSSSANGVAAFDTDPAGPNFGGLDEDLLVDTGIALILQNDAGSFGDQTVAGIFDTPDDDPQGGVLTFDFDDVSVLLLSVDLIDINGGGAVSLTLTDGAGLTRTYSVPDDWTGDIEQLEVGIQTLDLTTLANQVGVGPGKPLATASEDAGFDASDVVLLTVDFDGSAALDNLSFVPEPSTFALLGLAVAGLASLGRKRR